MGFDKPVRKGSKSINGSSLSEEGFVTKAICVRVCCGLENAPSCPVVVASCLCLMRFLGLATLVLGFRFELVIVHGASDILPSWVRDQDKDSFSMGDRHERQMLSLVGTSNILHLTCIQRDAQTPYRLIALARYGLYVSLRKDSGQSTKIV